MATTGQAFGILGILVNIIGAYLIAKSDLISNETVKRMSQPHYDINPFLQAELVKRRRNSKLGLIIMAVGSGILALGVING